MDFKNKAEKLYEALSLDVENIAEDTLHDYLTINEDKNKNMWLWYCDGVVDGAINIDTEKIITDSEEINELFL